MERAKACKVFIGTNFNQDNIDNWVVYLERLSQSGYFKAVEGQLEICPETKKVHIQYKIWCITKRTIKGVQDLKIQDMGSLIAV